MLTFTTDLDCSVKEHPAWITRIAIALIQSAIAEMRGDVLLPSNQGADDAAERKHECKIQAWRWCEKNHHEFPGFLWCCEIIGADPDYIRYAYLDGSINDWESIDRVGNNKGINASDLGFYRADLCFPLKRA